MPLKTWDCKQDHFNPIPELRKTYVNGIMGSNGPQCTIKKVMKEKTK